MNRTGLRHEATMATWMVMVIGLAGHCCRKTWHCRQKEHGGLRAMRAHPIRLALLLALFLSTSARFAAAQPTPQPQTTPPAVRYWTTDWSFSNIDVNSLLSRLQAIGIAVPIEADGIVSVDLAVSVPLTRLRDGKAYRLQGKITSQRLRVQRMVLEDLQADVVYRDGVMALKPARARWSEIQGGSVADQVGEFSGDVSIELLPLGNLQANLQANDIPIGSIQELIRGTPGDIDSKAGADRDRAGSRSDRGGGGGGRPPLCLGRTMAPRGAGPQRQRGAGAL